jgi:hypothetical protein
MDALEVETKRKKALELEKRLMKEMDAASSTTSTTSTGEDLKK